MTRNGEIDPFVCVTQSVDELFHNKEYVQKSAHYTLTNGILSCRGRERAAKAHTHTSDDSRLYSISLSRTYVCVSLPSNSRSVLFMSATLLFSLSKLVGEH